MRHEELSRQLDIIPIDILSTPITVIGAGAIGSWTTLALAKMGFQHITVFDHDEVDKVNMASQCYSFFDVGKRKASALADKIAQFTGSNEIVTAIPEKWHGMKMTGVVVMAVDSMETRKEIFEAHKLHYPCTWMIDARMGAETALLYTINPHDPKDQEFYSKTLYTDEEAVQEPCTAKSTTYCALTLSGLVAQAVSDTLARKKYARNMAFSLKEKDYLTFSVDLREEAK